MGYNISSIIVQERKLKFCCAKFKKDKERNRDEWISNVIPHAIDQLFIFDSTRPAQ